MSYRVILGDRSRERAEAYARSLASGSVQAGKYLRECLQSRAGSQDGAGLLEALLQTKRPQIFAESAVAGDGSDWNATELSILGDISIATPVTVFDDGRHRDPRPHKRPFTGTLVFTCGALLRNGFGIDGPDFLETVVEGSVDQERFTGLYSRRLIPVLHYIQETARASGRDAVVTIPGLGCGQFAGRFGGQVGDKLRRALMHILEQEAGRLDRIRLVRFDPYDECEDQSGQYHRTTFRTRPLSRSVHPLPQLCEPGAYAEDDDRLDDCELYSLVAWDQVSWPGNDYYLGARSTDDGVKAAATSSMTAMTGVAGRYSSGRFMYLPPAEYANWLDVVRANNMELRIAAPFVWPGSPRQGQQDEAGPTGSPPGAGNAT